MGRLIPSKRTRVNWSSLPGLLCFGAVLAAPSVLQALELHRSDTLVVNAGGFYRTVGTYTERNRLEIGDIPTPFGPVPAHITQHARWEDTNRVHLSFTAQYNERWSLQFDPELILRGRTGAPIENFPGADTGGDEIRDGELAPLTREFANDRDFVSTGNIDRLSLAYADRNIHVRVGRQALSWGVGHIWRPLDVFRPFGPTDFDTIQKPGVDAAVVTIPFAQLSEIRAVYAPEENTELSSAALRVTHHIKGYDVSLSGGYIAEDYLAAVDAVGTVWGAAVRGEFVYTAAHDAEHYWQLVAGGDYTWKDWYFLVEYYHDSRGATDTEDYLPLLPSVGRDNLFGLGRDYAGAMTSYSISPLWTVSLTTIANVHDASIFAGPQVTYAPWASVDVTAGANIAAGPPESEFHLSPNTWFVIGTWYF